MTNARFVAHVTNNAASSKNKRKRMYVRHKQQTIIVQSTKSIFGVVHCIECCNTTYYPTTVLSSFLKLEKKILNKT